MCLKPENVMERETAQDEMLGALVELLDIDDAYVRFPGVWVRLDQVGFQVSLGIV